MVRMKMMMMGEEGGLGVGNGIEGFVIVGLYIGSKGG